MFKRLAQTQLHQMLAWSPAVAILGPRQVGKTTLAQSLVQTDPQAIYLDLENPQDQARLGDGVLFFQANPQRRIILDEVQNAPGLFSALRGEIDRDRTPGRFVLLGSVLRTCKELSDESRTTVTFKYKSSPDPLAL